MRSELFHPVISHFPIVLLTLYPFILALSFFVTDWKKQLQFTARFLLYLGLVTQFLSLFLGDLALEAISKTFCKLPMAYNHETWAEYLLITNLLIVGVDVLDLSEKVKNEKVTFYGKLILSFISLWLVYKTGHSGAELVYEYGAGVEILKACQ